MAKVDEVHVFVDNSNVWIEGKRIAGRKCSPPVPSNGRYRIDYGNLLGVVQDGRLLADVPRLYGSEPPPNDSVWEMIRSKGFEVEVFKRNIFNKEKGVDMKMGMDITKLLYTAPYPGTVVVVAGDADFVPILEEVNSVGWKSEVWYWSNVAKALKSSALRCGELDPYLLTIGFEEN